MQTLSTSDLLFLLYCWSWWNYKEDEWRWNGSCLCTLFRFPSFSFVTSLLYNIFCSRSVCFCWRSLVFNNNIIIINNDRMETLFREVISKKWTLLCLKRKNFKLYVHVVLVPRLVLRFYLIFTREFFKNEYFLYCFGLVLKRGGNKVFRFWVGSIQRSSVFLDKRTKGEEGGLSCFVLRLHHRRKVHFNKQIFILDFQK